MEIKRAYISFLNSSLLSIGGLTKIFVDSKDHRRSHLFILRIFCPNFIYYNK